MKNGTTVSKEGWTIRLRKEMIKDNHDKIWCPYWYLENNEYYELKIYEWALTQSTETSTELAIENLGIKVGEDEALESEESQIQVKVVEIIIKTFVPTFLCPVCKSQVEMENVTTWCKIFENVALKIECKEKASVKNVVRDGDMISYYLRGTHVLNEKLL